MADAETVITALKIYCDWLESIKTEEKANLKKEQASHDWYEQYQNECHAAVLSAKNEDERDTLRLEENRSVQLIWKSVANLDNLEKECDKICWEIDDELRLIDTAMLDVDDVMENE